MSEHCYVWYRVERDDPDTERAILGMLVRLACRTGARGRLLKRPDEPTLWLEVYEGIADPPCFLTKMRLAADEFDIGMFIDGERHVERFITVAEIAGTCRAETN